jgi:DNA (cytosine-5)-methyltransferase 1
MMQVIDLFSGIGGFSLAAHWMGWETVQFCELDKKCQKVLKKNFPDVPIHDDIKTLKGEQIKTNPERPVIIVGGFPCQSYSIAGKRRGSEDSRHLWPEMLRVIKEVKPKYIVGENVAGLVNWKGGVVFEDIHTDLESEGYSVQAFMLPACSVEAYHKRQRVWFVAYHDVQRCGESGVISEPKKKAEFSGMGNTTRIPDWSETESPICGTDDGFPGRVDRLKQLGNSIVPQVVFQIFKVIQTLED